MLKLAEKIARKLPHKYKLCAIITDKKDNILGIGTNSYTKSHPKQASYAKLCGCSERIYLHAEIDAITRIRSGKPHRIYISRARGKEEVGAAKPCSICELAIREAGIKEVIYTV